MRENFIKDIINEDLKNKRFTNVHTRFPPEPNGYLHIGHAKSIYINFTIAKEYNGLCNLRFDDTNPETETQEYADSIIRDVKWLGFDWQDRLYFTSDYFEKLYEFAVQLIKKNKAYVCDLSNEEISKYRGTITQPGIESPYRNRSIEENLDLFRRMKDGEFKDGSKVLRAKIDMIHPNLLMRDPVLYRIKKASHYRAKDNWCIYPTYDFAHCISDALEGITHSICTLEFEVHRPLYDWILNELNLHHPRQVEFARLNISNTVLSKRKVSILVEKKYVDGWDDPRLLTIAGLRRRGYTPSSIIRFCEHIGVSKTDSIVEIELLEHFIREELNKTAKRVMAVLNPVKLIIDNYDETKEEELEAINNPEDPSFGTRKVHFCREIYIEEEDFCENPPEGFYRLSINREVRLRYAYVIAAKNVVKDESGKIKEIHCIYYPQTRGGNAKDNKKIKATLHWVSARRFIEADVYLYDLLFTKRDPEETEEGKDFTSNINPDSLKILKNCKLELSLKDAKVNDRYQFERLGYFFLERIEPQTNKMIFNRIVTLKDKWSKIKNEKRDYIGCR